MRLTKKLLGWLNRVFDKNPAPALALRLSYNGTGMTWQVDDGVLTTIVTGGTGTNLSVDLSQYTLTGLVNYLAAQPGYSVLYADTGDLAPLSALVLIDDANDIAKSNGDHLYAYTNPNYAVLEAYADELEQAAAQIPLLPAELATNTADGEWLDLLGSYYAVPRLAGEGDRQYGDRIIAEVLRPKSNNVALEDAIRTFTGQAVQVTDVVEYANPVPAYDASITHNGTHTHNATAKPIYGLFDVQTGYDLLGGTDPTSFRQTVTDLVNRLRAAGTFMRALSLQGSAISDAVTPPTDAGLSTLAVAVTEADTVPARTDAAFAFAGQLAGMSDAAGARSDAASLSIVYGVTHSGTRLHDGSVTYQSGTVVETI